MNTLSLALMPTRFGWSVVLSDGRELARFVGFRARERALRFAAGVR